MATSMFVETPVTHSEMRVLLEPLHTSVLRMESLLLQLSDSPKKLDDFSATKGPIALISPEPGVRPVFPTQDSDHSLPSPEGLATANSTCAGDVGTPAEICGHEVSSEPGASVEHHNSITADDKDLETVLAVIETRHISNVLSKGVGYKKSNLDKGISLIEGCYSWWSRIREPTRRTRTFQLVTSDVFESVCMVAIVVNSFLVAYSADWQMQHIGMSEPASLKILQYVLFVFFFIELFLRLVAHRCYFFLNHDAGWNIFDFVLVSISLVDFVFDELVGMQAGGNIGFMRLLRLLKMARIMRSVRSFKFFKSLAVVLQSFRTSFNCLFWGFALIGFVLYLCALVMMQALVDYLTVWKDIDALERSKIKSAFGSLYATLLTLYMAVTGGQSWEVPYNIISRAGQTYGIFFVAFTFFFLFALVNIITGTIVEKAMSANKPDRADIILNQRRRMRDQKKEFMEICIAMDVDKDGNISYTEFEKWMQSPIMVAYLASVGIEIADIELFFENVGARANRSGNYVNEGEVTIEHFVQGCLHMRGSATALDMQRQLFEIDILHQELSTLTNHVQHVATLISQGVNVSKVTNIGM